MKDFLMNLMYKIGYCIIKPIYFKLIITRLTGNIHLQYLMWNKLSKIFRDPKCLRFDFVIFSMFELVLQILVLYGDIFIIGSCICENILI